MTEIKQPQTGLALGSGGAKGLHTNVMRRIRIHQSIRFLNFQRESRGFSDNRNMAALKD